MRPASSTADHVPKVLSSSILNSFRGRHPILSSSSNHIVLHTWIFLIICITTADLHQIIQFMHKIRFFLLCGILHNKNSILFRERFFMKFHYVSLCIQFYSGLCDKPAQHFSVFKILFTVLICIFPCFIIDHVFIADQLQVVHLNRTIYVYIFLILALLHISYEKCTDRSVLRLVTKL